MVRPPPPRLARHVVACAAVALALACATRPAPPAAAPPVETGDLPMGTAADADTLLADVRALDSTLVVQLRYATPSNFTGAPLPGYEANRALLRREAAAALARVEQHAFARGYRLKIFDAYRPVRATDAMVAWTRRVGRPELIADGYIASRSRHNLGVAVDLTLVDRASGVELDMGTPFDTFSPVAHTANASGDVLRHRLLLKNFMEAEGFVNYDQEWWHYSYTVASPVRFDVVIREAGSQ